MASSKINWTTWLKIGRSWAVRFQLLGLLIGVLGTIGSFVLTDFWDFRDRHQEIVIQYYQDAEKERKEFDNLLASLGREFDRIEVASFYDVYARRAQEYISTLETVSTALPSTQEQLVDFMTAISSIAPIYQELEEAQRTNAPEQDNLLLYGRYREALNNYVEARDSYWSAVVNAVSSYPRYLMNT